MKFLLTAINAKFIHSNPAIYSLRAGAGEKLQPYVELAEFTINESLESILKQCTESRDHVKVVIRHIWEPYMEKCEDIRHTIGMKEVYAQRKETVERLFGTAKENHGFRYTQMIGKARMEMKVGLTFACMNLKKLAKMIARKGKRGAQKCLLLIKYTLFEPKTRKTLLEC